MFDGLRLQHWHSAMGADAIIVLTLDCAGRTINTLSRAVLEELAAITERLAIEPPAGIVIQSAKSAGFAAGADIGEFERYARTGSVLDAITFGQKTFESLSRLRCPTVAAIHGHCLGGGLELALACRARIAAEAPETRLGLPEVRLGIHPGWGGTARLPYLIGAPAALDLMLTGRTVSASRARALGLVDATAPIDGLLAAARRLARHPPATPLQRRLLATATNTWPARQLLAPAIRKKAAAKARPSQYPAPFAVIDVWRRGGNITRRLRREAESVATLAGTSTCHNLVRLFFLSERLKALGDATDPGIAHVHVIGAGVMGGDIAAWAALRGLSVTLQDREMQFVQPALERARELFRAKLKDADRAGAATARLSADVEGNGVANADLVIEAIFEDAEAKRALYRQVEPKMKRDALLASNTSSIPLASLAGALARPDRFLGLHFFNPVAKMPLVEVVRHSALERTAEQRGLAFCRAIDKLPLPVAGTPGFLVNRVLTPYLLEAIRMRGEGVPGPVIDRAATDFGMPVGPIELADTVGLDVAAAVGRELAPALGLDPPPGIDALSSSTHRGRKDGQGFYKWEGGRPVKPPVDPGYHAPEDLLDRLILPLVNEAIACLHDRVADDADLLDAGIVFGTGFAPFRGGPVAYVRHSGVAAVRERLERLAATHGTRFAPRPGWDDPTLASTQ
ncbi:MAG: 3-hydroxyacyl-CoA dehydrogenase NAD-binding domain-containing protein [Lysobacterales bacterium]